MTTEIFIRNIDNRLRDLLRKKQTVYPEKLYNACKYALFPGGKRVRPCLSYMTADFVNVSIKKIVPLALSVELIHNYSLIHDDLPCMDDDDYRRGKPSCHVAFGEAMAVLAGDCLLNLAYETLFSAVADDNDLADSAFLIAESAGGNGMIGGQAMELCVDHFDEETVTDLCRKKTGAILTSSIMSVAILSGDKRKIDALSTFSRCLGLCFQIVDDLLDEQKCEEKSYLAVVGKEKAINMIDRLTALMEKTLSPFGEEAEELLSFARSLSFRKS